MRWVESAVIRPHRCAVIPFKGSDPEGFIDTGSELDGFDNHVYVSVSAVREMARLIGEPSKGDYNAIVTQANELARLYEAAQRDVVVLKAELDAIDVLESSDHREFKRRKRTGRPPARKEEEVAA